MLLNLYLMIQNSFYFDIYMKRIKLSILFTFKNDQMLKLINNEDLYTTDLKLTVIIL